MDTTTVRALIHNIERRRRGGEDWMDGGAVSSPLSRLLYQVISPPSPSRRRIGGEERLIKESPRAEYKFLGPKTAKRGKKRHG